MKKFTSFALVLMMMAALFAGCGGGDGGGSAGAADAADTPAAQGDAQADGSGGEGTGEKIELVFAHGQQGSSSPGRAIQAYADAVREASDGMIEITVYPGSQLGAERDVMEGLTMGSIDMAYVSSGVCENYESMFGIMNLPFLFDGYEHLDAVLDNDEVVGILRDGLAQNGINTLTILNQGIRYTYTSVELDDLTNVNGLKIRVPEAPMAQGIWRNLNGNPTAISWNEVYTSMSTKIVDAFEVHAYAVIMENLQETFQYAYLTGHQVSSSAVMVSASVWDSLPADAQRILTDCLDTLEAENYNNIVGDEPEMFQIMRDAGIEVVEVDAATKAAMREACMDLYDTWAAENEGGQALIDLIDSMR